MRGRVVVAVVAGGVAALSLVLWRCHERTRTAASARAAATATHHDAGAAGRHDPRTLQRASIAGAITDRLGHPIAGARVCAVAASDDLPTSVVEEPRCATSKAGGGYMLDSLIAARYQVTAMARPYRFETAADVPFRLAAGEHRAGVDIVLGREGFELAGHVEDISGGPIAHASVVAVQRDRRSPAVETDARGAFSLWVAPDPATLEASADGYADGESIASPFLAALVKLTPEASIAGTVVDAATHEPVSGARVVVTSGERAGEFGAHELTDERGQFRIRSLAPDRYRVIATQPDRYGQLATTQLVGLGQHVENLTIELFPAYRIAGRVVSAVANAPCATPAISVHAVDSERWLTATETDPGTLQVEGLIPGTYDVYASCTGSVSEAKDRIAITDRDATGREWRVPPAGTVRGVVRRRSGGPVARAQVAVGESFMARSVLTAASGEYALAGLIPGKQWVSVSGDGIASTSITVDISGTETVTRDILVDDGGTLSAHAVDRDGQPLAAGFDIARVGADAAQPGDVDEGPTDLELVMAMSRGAPLRRSVAAGEYRVTSWVGAQRQQRTVTVRAGATTDVAFAFDIGTAVISGTVVDAHGRPIADAFVVAVREIGNMRGVLGTRWGSWGAPPVLTGPDGAFTIAGLRAGPHAVRAYRNGGGEAYAEHVAAGSTVRLALASTGSIAGSVRTGGRLPELLTVAITARELGFERSEPFFRTGGRFSFADLPPGSYHIEIDAPDGRADSKVELAAGENKTVVVDIEPLVTVVGRVVEVRSHAPVSMLGLRSYGVGNRSEPTRTDGDGRFSIRGVPPGTMFFELESTEYRLLTTQRVIRGRGTIDLGEVGVIKPRLAAGQQPGRRGFELAFPKLEVASIEPDGPAAHTDLRVGDVIVAIDGIDVQDASGSSALLWEPPGTEIKLGLARGVTITIVFAPPR